jgi:hypothetical protein
MSSSHSTGSLVHAILGLGLFSACQAGSLAPEVPGHAVISNRFPAIDPPSPSIVYAGGRFVRHPRLVTITWKGDDQALVSRLEAFGASIARGTWWTSVTKNLCARVGDCIGPGGDASSVQIDEPAPRSATLAELASMMAALVDQGTMPIPDDDRVYLAYLPKGSSIAGIDDGCARFGTRAVHTTFAWPGGSRSASWPVAFVLRCGDDLGELTATASHELLETASDPALDGFQLDRDPRSLPFSLHGTEAVDLCSLITLDDHRAHVDGWVVDRVWSNQDARAGRDPCVPHRANDPYVAVIPKQPSVTVTQGHPGAVDLVGISERMVPTWSVAAFEIAVLRGERGCLALDLDRRDANNGTTLALTVSVVRRCRRNAAVILVSTLGTRSHAWPLLVEIR